MWYCRIAGRHVQPVDEESPSDGSHGMFIAPEATCANILKPQRGGMFIASGDTQIVLKPQRGDMFIARDIHQTPKPQRGDM